MAPFIAQNIFDAKGKVAAVTVQVTSPKGQAVQVQVPYTPAQLAPNSTILRVDQHKLLAVIASALQAKLAAGQVASLSVNEMERLADGLLTDTDLDAAQTYGKSIPGRSA